MTTYSTTADYLRHIDEIRPHYTIDDLHMLNRMSYMQGKIDYDTFTQATYHISHNNKTESI